MDKEIFNKAIQNDIADPELCLKKIAVEIRVSVWYNAEKPMKMEIIP